MTDWENVDEITLYNGARVAAPWVQGTTLSSTPEFATDIKKEDGWVMLYHTFKALNTYPNVNDIALYNRLTGFLKFFYYLESNLSNNNGGMWYYQTSNGMPTSLFNLNNYVALPNDASNKYNFVATSNISTTPTDGFKNGWNGFEIEVPYTTDYTNIPFTLSSSSNPQPIGFSGILLAKRQNSFYCTYFLHNRNVADTKSPYPIKRLEVIRWFNQKSMVFNQSLS